MNTERRLRKYQAPVWDEPIVMEMGQPGRRGFVPPALEPAISEGIGDPTILLPAGLARRTPPALPELSELEVARHYLHLSQENLGMMGISLFGTCTMKYNPRINERMAGLSQLAELHPCQPEESLQGVLEIMYELDLFLRELTGMDRFSFQAPGGSDAAFIFACMTRAYHAARGELDQRTEVIVSIQSHPCNAATAATAGFDVVTLMLGPDGYPPLDALKAAVSQKTAALMIVNPDDIGIYNPHIAEWNDIVHEAGGLCFHDQANFNGTMGQVRTRELGFDACMTMLHKTFGAPKGSLGPAVGAFGCTAELTPFLPRPLVERHGDYYRLDQSGEASIGRVREFLGNVPVVVKAFTWARAMGIDGIREGAELSVLANNYMEQRILQIPGIAKAYPDLQGHVMEIARYSLATLTEETGVTVAEISNRMLDFGIDAPWLSHHPLLTPEPLTTETGESWSKEDIDYWIDVLSHVCDEAYTDPEIVRTAPHNQVVAKVDLSRVDDPKFRATTWRAYLRKQTTPASEQAPTNELAEATVDRAR